MPITYATEKVLIQNSSGFHVRPVTAFVQTASKFKSNVRILFGEQTANGKSAVECTLLAAPFGSEFILEAEGEDAEQVIKELVKLFINKFGIE